MFDHPVLSDHGVGSRNAHAAEDDSPVDIVVLTPPAPVGVREAVDLQVLAFRQRGNSAEVRVVGQVEVEFVHGHSQVSRVVKAPVEVTVVHRDQIYVREDKAVVIVLLHCFHVACVHQFSPVEHALSILVDDVHRVVQLLSHQYRMEVMQPINEVLVPIAERDDDRHLNK